MNLMTTVLKVSDMKTKTMVFPIEFECMDAEERVLVKIDVQNILNQIEFYIRQYELDIKDKEGIDNFTH